MAAVARSAKFGYSGSEHMKEEGGAVVPWENPVLASLKEKKPVVGITLSTPSVEIAAQTADMGFECLWIHMEHSPITLDTARNMILPTTGEGVMPTIRV